MSSESLPEDPDHNLEQMSASELFAVNLFDAADGITRRLHQYPEERDTNKKYVVELSVEQIDWIEEILGNKSIIPIDSISFDIKGTNPFVDQYKATTGKLQVHVRYGQTVVAYSIALHSTGYNKITTTKTFFVPIGEMPPRGKSYQDPFPDPAVSLPYPVEISDTEQDELRMLFNELARV